MKTLIFLHREQLTQLYLSIAKYLTDKINVIHIAYSDKEEKLLQEVGIKDIVNFTTRVSTLFDSEKINTVILKEIDSVLIENTNGRFNLNQALQSDRGFSVLNYTEAQLAAQVYYKFWIEIFDGQKVDYVIHEPCSLFFNHICAVICKAQGGEYIWHAMTVGDEGSLNYLNITGDGYTCPEIKMKYDFYTTYPEKIDKTRCLNFINKFRSNYEIYLGDMINQNASKFYLGYKVIREKIGRFKNRNRYDKLKNNIDYWLCNKSNFEEKLRNICAYKKQNIVFEDIPINETYYYYSFHLEPEAVVLYLSDGIYTNQIKLIENIAAALPVNTYLYVKDHPHELGYRDSIDYKRLQGIPNVRILKQSIPGKLVIKNAIGVFTINGTAGFEGLLLGKQVYTFGWSHYCYSPRVNYIHNIRDIRDVVYKNQNIIYSDDECFLAYVNAYLESLHGGMMDFFMDRASKYGIDIDANAKQIAEDFIKYSERF